jgi:hypothetical protein
MSEHSTVHIKVHDVVILDAMLLLGTSQMLDRGAIRPRPYDIHPYWRLHLS